MEKLVDQGLVKHIGVSNFSVKKMKDLLTYARIKPAVNQIEVHPYFRNDYNIDWCRSQARLLETPACPQGFFFQEWVKTKHYLVCQQLCKQDRARFAS